ncbi:crotonase/enoyl-CoA hydratase family protein [Deltaproteobacteria bacterium TL4]
MKNRVLLEIKDDLAFVTLNRPEKYNGLDMPMFEGIVAAAKKISRKRNVRAVILKGEGPAFSSGLDVMNVIKNPLALARLLLKPGLNISNLAQDVSYVWRQLPVPVIAVLHGNCYGGGFQIALGADFRITTPDCQFSIMEMKWGLIPDMTGSITLRELIPIDLAKELTMTARVFSGVEAKEYGLVTKVSDKPLEDAVEMAKEFATRSPDAIAYVKKLFNSTWVADDKTALKWETQLQKKLLGRWNQLAAVSKNVSKSPLNYHNRNV